MGTRQSIRVDSTTQWQMTLKECCLWLLGQHQRFRVSGHSMEPLARDGDQVFMMPFHNRGHCHVGDIVICRHPQDRTTLVMKCVEQVHAPLGMVWLVGENAEPGHSMGWVDNRLVQGFVTAIIRRRM